MDVSCETPPNSPRPTTIHELDMKRKHNRKLERDKLRARYAKCWIHFEKMKVKGEQRIKEKGLEPLAKRRLF